MWHNAVEPQRIVGLFDAQLGRSGAEKRSFVGHPGSWPEHHFMHSVPAGAAGHAYFERQFPRGSSRRDTHWQPAEWIRGASSTISGMLRSQYSSLHRNVAGAVQGHLALKFRNLRIFAFVKGGSKFESKI
jgi:hypothetical protein